MQVAGRVAMITGGGSGIGRATALMLAGEGANIVVADLDANAGNRVVDEVRGLGRDAITMATDTTAKDQVHRLVKAGVDRFGKVDILINGAGITHRSPIREFPEDAWDRVLAVHLKSTFLCSQAVLDSMIEGGWGRIINIISRAAFKGRPLTGPYSAAKGGMLAMSRVLAAEVAQHGVTVNNVAPGTTLTPMVQKTFPTVEDQAEEARSSGVITKPVRLAQTEEMAAAIMYFCGPHSGHTTGMTIHVNGGTYMP